MSPESRQRFDRPSLRKRATPGSKESAPRATTLFSRKIVNSEPQELHTAHTFHDALTPRTADSPESNSTGSTTQVIIPWSTPELLAELASAWDLHPVLVDDLFHANQRAKVERYGAVLFAVLKSAVYIDAKEEVEFNEFHLLM